MKTEEIDKRLDEICERAGLFYGTENMKALEIVCKDYFRMKEVKELVQELGLKEPVLTKSELMLYKRLKEICYGGDR